MLELVPGETLAVRLERGPLSVTDAVAVCSQIARAVEAAHAKGIVHRDLKPANVMITSEGNVKVLDLGLAKTLAPLETAPASQLRTETVTLTGEGVVLGTVPYMSPEQLRGHPVDGRTDVWAFGCILYENGAHAPARLWR